jgi:hypothetical protein
VSGSHVAQKTTVDLEDDIHVPRQDPADEVHRPGFQCFGQHRVVGVGKGFFTDGPGVVPCQPFLVHEQAHEFGNGDGRVGVVELDGNEVGQFCKITFHFFESSKNVGQGGGHEKVLLFQAQLPALFHLIAGVEHTGDVFAEHLGFDGTDVVALVEFVQVELPAGPCPPQPHIGDEVIPVAGDEDIAGHGHDHFAVNPAVTLAAGGIGVGFGVAVKAHRDQIFSPADFPGGSLAGPVVALFPLPAIFNGLVEDAVIVADAVTVSGKVQAGQRIHVAGGQAPQTAVSQTGIPFFLFQFLKIKAHLLNRPADFVDHFQADQIVHEKASRQKFQGEKVNPLGQGVVLGALRANPPVHKAVADAVCQSHETGMAVGLCRVPAHGETDVTPDFLFECQVGIGSMIVADAFT